MNFKKLTIGFGIAVIVLLIFQAGVIVGYHKGRFSARFGDNYYHTFGGRYPDFLPKMTPSGHGAVGKIVSVTWPTFILAGSDNIEKIILIKSDTIIRQFRDTVASSSLTVNDSVVVLGTPNNQGEIEARLIRIITP